MIIELWIYWFLEVIWVIIRFCDNQVECPCRHGVLRKLFCWLIIAASAAIIILVFGSILLVDFVRICWATEMPSQRFQHKQSFTSHFVDNCLPFSLDYPRVKVCFLFLSDAKKQLQAFATQTLASRVTSTIQSAFSVV